jgi:organic radical activating enzyme
MSHYYHPPGELSRTAILDIGLRCTHSCKFCYYSFLDNGADQFHGMRHAAFRDSHGLLQLVTNLRRNEFLGFDVTGGEPTLHPAIVRLIEHGTNLGLYSRIITLGQFLLRSMRGATRPLLEELLEAGLTNLLFSFHSSDDNEFNALTGASLSKQLAAMDHLAKRDFQFTTNTVVIAENARRIPEIAKRLVQTNTYLHNFIMMNPYYEWNNGGRAFGILPRYTELLPSLNEAIAILAAANIACNIRYAPLCGLPGLEKHIVGVAGVRYDPYEWMNRESHRGEVDPVQAAAPWQVERGSVQAEFCLYRVAGSGKADPSVFAVRGPSGSRVLPAICQNCTLLPACDGVNPKYLANFGSGELCPYDDRGVLGVLTEVRRSYVPAFLVKTASDTDMRRIYRRFLSPSPSADRPRVSVVITTYNNGSTVVRFAVRA